MPKGMIQSYPFYCDHLGALKRDEEDITSRFYIKESAGMGLEQYIKHHAFREEDAGIMRTYLVRVCETDELVGYYSLKAGLISYNEQDRGGHIEFDTLPGVELANFAVNSAYIDAHPNYKGIGAIIFSEFVVPIIEKTSEDIGIRVVYLFALPIDKLINRYETYGFMRLDKKSEDSLHARLKPVYDESCVFMYQLLA